MEAICPLSLVNHCASSRYEKIASLLWQPADLSMIVRRKNKNKKTTKAQNIRKNDRTSPNLFPVVQRETAFVCWQSQVRSQWICSTLHLLTCIADMHVHTTTAENTRGLLFVFSVSWWVEGNTAYCRWKTSPSDTCFSLISCLVHCCHKSWSLFTISPPIISNWSVQCKLNPCLFL